MNEDYLTIEELDHLIHIIEGYKEELSVRLDPEEDNILDDLKFKLQLLLDEMIYNEKGN